MVYLQGLVIWSNGKYLSQTANLRLMTTKPNISDWIYLMKMSDFEKEIV